MFSFLEGEGAEVLVEPVTTWICYLLNQSRAALADRKNLGDDGVTTSWRQPQKRLAEAVRHSKKGATLHVAERILTREYNRLREALGGTTHELVNQLELVRVGHPYYNSRAGGGEGHLEVAKNIYYTNKGLCHMVLSLKPFGCMPSAQSDGAQAAVVSHFKDIIFLPIETSGEGDINAYSRVQMALGEAKLKCKEEFVACVKRTGYTLDEIRAYAADNRELRRPTLNVPKQDGVIGKAANFVLFVAEKMRANGAASAEVQQEEAAAIA
ncbi:MAG: hypothetical protein V3T70_09205 [Phycisphaerae bacterium]